MTEQEIKNHFERFYRDADAAHGLKHIKEVHELASKINRSLKEPYSEIDILVASYAHDMYSLDYRDTHHTLAGLYILKDLPSRFKKEMNNVSLVASAVAEHRASFKGKYSSKLSEVLSAADRGEPNLEKIIERIYLTSIDNRLNFKFKINNIPSISINNTSLYSKIATMLDDGNFKKTDILVFGHLIEKYSRNGYARYNSTYKKYFKEELENMYKRVDDIFDNPKLIRDYISNYKIK